MLNTSTSIVDFLKSKGKLSDFESRKRLYESTGLTNTLGDYRGSDIQNVQFLKALQSAPMDADITKPPLTAEEMAGQEQQKLAVPQQFRDIVPPTPVIEPTADDILSEVRKRPSVQFGEAGAAQAKSTIETAAKSAESSALENLSNRGLIRSPGMVAGAIEPIKAEKIAKDLNIDLSLAKIVASAIEEDSAAKLKAETDRQKSIDAFLETQGLARNPLTGEITKSKKFEMQEATQSRAEEASQRAERSLQLAELRLEESKKTGSNLGIEADDKIYNVVAGMAEGKANQVMSIYANMKKQKGDDAANKYIDSIIYQNLRATERNDFQLYDTAEKKANDALEKLNKMSTTDFNRYKGILESGKSLALIAKDPQWLSTVQDITASQMQIIRSFFGTAITPTEAESVNRLKVDVEKDNLQDAIVKLQGLKEMARDFKVSKFQYGRGEFDNETKSDEVKPTQEDIDYVTSLGL